jgi:prepilin-type N-terminal cleavage/methylation domain-containing protein
MTAPCTAATRSAFRPRRKGYSLVEIMVALAIGAIIILGLAEILSGTSDTYRREAAFARLQENGRIAALVASRHMRQSRSTECRSLAMHEEYNSLTVKACAMLTDTSCALGDHYLTTDRALGYDGDLSNASSLADMPPAIATNIADRWALGDVLVSWGVGPEGEPLKGALGDSAGQGLADGTGRINVSTLPEGLDVGGLAMVSNCRSAHVFTVTGPTSGSTSGQGQVYVEHAAGANAVADLVGSTSYTGSAPYNRDDGDPRALLHRLDYRVFYICCVKDGVLQSGASVKACRPDDSATALPMHALRSVCMTSTTVTTRRSWFRMLRTCGSPIPETATATAPLISAPMIHRLFRNAAWVSAQNAWSAVRSASVELLLTTSESNTAAEQSRPARAIWPPNDGSGTIDADTLGSFAYGADSRVYHRIRFDVALRPSTPWMILD